METRKGEERRGPQGPNERKGDGGGPSKQGGVERGRGMAFLGEGKGTERRGRGRRGVGPSGGRTKEKRGIFRGGGRGAGGRGGGGGRGGAVGGGTEREGEGGHRRRGAMRKTGAEGGGKRGRDREEGGKELVVHLNDLKLYLFYILKYLNFKLVEFNF